MEGDRRPSPREARTEVHAGYHGVERGVFSLLHEPERSTGLGVVLCPPHGYEGVQAYRSLRCLADELAARGHVALRVDYPGVGESPGDPMRSGQVGLWCDAVKAGIETVTSFPDVSRIVLVGLRSGTLIAHAVAESAEVAVEGLVLWEPPASGAAYVREMEILAAGSRRPSVGEDDGEDGPDNLLLAGGYPLTEETRQDLARLSFAAEGGTGRPDVLLIQRGDRRAFPGTVKTLERSGHAVQTIEAPDHAAMMRPPATSVVPRQTIESVVEWLAPRVSTPQDATTGVPPALMASTTIHGDVERAVRWSDGRIFGILTRPVEAEVRRKALLLVGGAVPRTGVNRMYVDVADSLARAGCETLRVDLPGVGESPPHPGMDHDRPFTSHVVDDVHTVLDELYGSGSGCPMGVVGLCSGAYAAFQVALTRDDVDRVLLINPWLLTRRDFAANFPPRWASRRAPTSDPGLDAIWQAVRRGEASPAFLGRSTLRRAVQALAARTPRLAEACSPWSDLSRDLRRMTGRGVHVTIVFSSGDPGEAPVRRRGGRTLRQLSDRGLVSVRVFEGADHAFGPLGPRARLETAIVEAIGGQGGYDTLSESG